MLFAAAHKLIYGNNVPRPCAEVGQTGQAHADCRQRFAACRNVKFLYAVGKLFRQARQRDKIVVVAWHAMDTNAAHIGLFLVLADNHLHKVIAVKRTAKAVTVTFKD